MTETPSDRRRHPRFQVRVPVQLTVGSEVHPAILKDLCRDAGLVEIRQPVELGREVSLLLKLPGTGGPLQVGGQVVRIAPGTEAGTIDIAVLFTNITPGAETRIEFFITLQEG
jgi:Tfp pilus assembly protein PilZ